MAVYPNIPEKVRNFYDRVLLVNALPVLCHTQFGAKPVIPTGKGDVYVWHRFSQLNLVTTPLNTEGIPPASHSFSITEVTAEPKPYGAYVRYTNEWNRADPDGGITNVVKLLGEQAGRSIDRIAREALVAGGYTVKYSGTAASRNEVSLPISYDGFVDALAELLAANARPFPNGRYACIMHVYTYARLLKDDEFRQVLVEAPDRGDRNPLVRGYVGSILNVDIFVTTDARVFEDAGASSADVALTLFMGQDWYGIVGLHAPTETPGANASVDRLIGTGENPSVRTIVREDGSDPFGRVAFVSWLTTMDVKVLNSAFCVGYESAL